MPDLLLLLPDFALIALGFVLCRYTRLLGRPLWDAVDKLVYHLLFPALLFGAIVRHPLDWRSTLGLAGAGVAVTAVGVALAQALRLWPGVDPRLHASGAQVAFRFNSYVALALAERLAGQAGVAWQALLVALCVPLCNVAAVWPLARSGGHHPWRELARNPLIVSTLAGLAYQLSGLGLPQLVSISLARVGGAALPLGLMAVGAGLQLGALREGPRLAAAIIGIRHLLLPALGTGLALALALPAAQQAVLVGFCAMPTASSAYVLAARMGGHGGYTAGLVSVSTLVAMPALPLALAALDWLR